jgi:hypothetical protein
LFGKKINDDRWKDLVKIGFNSKSRRRRKEKTTFFTN